MHVSAETLAGDGEGAGEGGVTPGETGDGESEAGPEAGGAARFGDAGTPAAGASEELAAEEPARIERGPRVSAETARRLACDAGVVVMTHDRAGNVLDVGRRTRVPPSAIRRALDHRDGGCRFPGCAARFCASHHVRHWARGGPTKLDNLVLLCPRHHRLVHEGGWRMELETETGNGGGRHRGRGRPVPRFYRPDGRPLPERPPEPALGDDPARGLERAQRGLGIDGWSATPRWDGARLDVDWVLFTLRRPAEPDVPGHHGPGLPVEGRSDGGGGDRSRDVSAETSSATGAIARDDRGSQATTGNGMAVIGRQQ